MTYLGETDGTWNALASLDSAARELAAEIHVDYPHEPGRLYDCPACESACHCDADPGTTQCVFDGEHDYDKS